MSVLTLDPTSWFCFSTPDCAQLSWTQALLFPLQGPNNKYDKVAHPVFLPIAVFASILNFNVSYLYLRRCRPMMFLSLAIGLTPLIGLLVCIMPKVVLAVDKTSDPELVAKLKSAATMLDRLNMLSDEQLVFNFTSNPKYSWHPGSVCNANAATWPILSTVGVTVSQLNLGPCAMLAPHFHRADNLVVAINGTTNTYMYQENGARIVEQILTPGMMTIFPRASVHTMYNTGCENNQLYSFLNDADASTINLAQALFMMPEDIGLTVMPFIELSNGNWTATGQAIPQVGTGSQAGFESCLSKCGLSPSGYGSTGPVVMG